MTLVNKNIYLQIPGKIGRLEIFMKFWRGFIVGRLVNRVYEWINTKYMMRKEWYID